MLMKIRGAVTKVAIIIINEDNDIGVMDWLKRESQMPWPSVTIKLRMLASVKDFGWRSNDWQHFRNGSDENS